MKGFLVALQFLTTIQVKDLPMLDEDDMVRSMRTYPLVGLMIGLMMVGVLWGLAWVMPGYPLVSGMFVLVVGVGLTGGLHLDGLMDSADGMLSYRPRERILEIMKDSRVGANGVIAVVLLLLTKGSLLASVANHAQYIPVVLAPVFARWAAVIMVTMSVHASGSEGLGSTVIGKATHREGVWVSICCAVVFALVLCGAQFLVSGLSALTTVTRAALLWVAAALVIFLVGTGSQRKIQGITGDVVGAAIELVEVAVLLGGLVVFGQWVN